jgi:hypothetical protein
MTSTTDSTPIEGSVHAETEMSSTSNSFSFSQSASSVENRATDLDLDEESDDSASSISTISTISSLDDAEQEWQESLQQLELLVSLVLIPFFGKWVGRRCAYWGTPHPPLSELHRVADRWCSMDKVYDVEIPCRSRRYGQKGLQSFGGGRRAVDAAGGSVPAALNRGWLYWFLAEREAQLFLGVVALFEHLLSGRAS